MTAKQKLKGSVQRSLYRLGYRVQRVTDEERNARAQSDAATQSVEDVFGYRLARLDDLRRRYAGVTLPVAVHSLWQTRKSTQHVAEVGWDAVDLRQFRASITYVWDYGATTWEASQLKYFIFADAVRQKDAAGLLAKLGEDGAFGCTTFEFAGMGRISRDLLDSVAELNFLQRHLKILDRDDLGVLDIGAGYGRMAHRMLEANPHLSDYTCVDAVPESTFLCEFYLSHRGLADRAEIIPLDELDTRLQCDRFGLALNIHSFSECTLAAIEWWLGRITALGVRHLMIVPNDADRFLSTEQDRSRLDYSPLLASLGWEVIAREPMFEDENVQTLLGVQDVMFLFERRAV